jgi:hypothetical protein
VQDAAAVEVGEGGEDLQQDVAAFGQRQVGGGLRDGDGGGEVLHGEKGLLRLVEAVVQHADDVRVPQRSQGVKFLRQEQA